MTPEYILAHATEHNKDNSNPTLYKSVKNFNDLLLLNLAYLSGVITCTDMYGPLEEETLPHLDKLRLLTAHGFLSCQSQPAVNESGVWNETNQYFYDLQQRPWVVGYIHGQFAYKLVQYLEKVPCVKYTVKFTNLKGYLNLTKGRVHLKNSAKKSKWEEESHAYDYNARGQGCDGNYAYVHLSGTHFGKGDMFETLLGFYKGSKPVLDPNTFTTLSSSTKK